MRPELRLRTAGPLSLVLLAGASLLIWSACRPPARSASDAPASAQGTAPASGCRGPGAGAQLPEPGRRTRPVDDRAGLDVLHYDLELDLREAGGGRVRGHARITLETGPERDRVRLDLVGLGVDSVRLDGGAAACRHDGAVLQIGPPAAGGGEEAAPSPREGEEADDTLAAGEHVVEVFYRGSPRDGLVFGTDGEGGPTAFADNWPNRARWWFPANDHPSDKATVRFEVRPPEGREVVANGRLVRRGGGDRGAWVWETDVEIPVYTMVVGVADFGTAVLGEGACGRAPVAAGGCVDVSMWALPGDSAFGRRVLRRAPDMADFYARRFGPFPYEKLGHVESGTRFGGMENASAIFYARKPWSEGEMEEGVVAHETVHQWFGDAVTPRRWRHLWISEGFATYFDAVYFGARGEESAFRDKMQAARDRYLGSDAVPRSVVDTTPDLYALLNANSYQKGAWVLHMLRGVVGDSAFFRGVRRYYAEHRDATAGTAEVRRAMEATSGRELGWFFDQWLRAPGYPRLEGEWWLEEAAADAGAAAGAPRGPGTARDGDGRSPPRPEGPRRTLVLAVRQTQPESWPAFRLPLTVAVERARRPAARREIELSGRADTVRVPVEGEVEEVRLDPEGRVLKTLELRRSPQRVPAQR